MAKGEGLRNDIQYIVVGHDGYVYKTNISTFIHSFYSQYLDGAFS